ncbi:unnamed protein product, partial [Adineta steineri]
MFRKKHSTLPVNRHEIQRLTASGRTEAVASSLQQRIYLHEQLYFHASDLSVYNFLVPLKVKYGSISIERIHSSLRSVIEQHTILRTAVYFNQANNQIEQHIQPLTDDIYSFQHSQGISTLEQLDDLLMNESIKKHFDVTKGKVLRCHVVQKSTENHNHSLHQGDFIIFNVHHIAFDFGSIKPFVKAFEQACCTDDDCQSTLLIPQYIDFALYEQAMLSDINVNSKMNKARRFWGDLMHDYDWYRIRRLVPEEDTNNKIRSGRGLSVAFHIEQDIVDAMMLFTSSNNVTMFSLSLACYYAFLYKLTKDDDLCVAGVVANRSTEEIKNMIGMFVNLVPYRIKIEPNSLFNHFVQKVQQLCTDVLEHASLPYQQIIEIQGKREHHALPSSSFQYESLMSTLTQNTSSKLIVGEGCILGAFDDRDTTHGNGTTLFDLALTVSHDHYARTTKCFLDCSTDLFKSQADVDLLANRFKHILRQLFCSSIVGEPSYNQCSISISNLSLILPEEIEEIQKVMFYRLPTIENEAPASYAQARIWLDERIRFNPDKLQVAIYNMPFQYRLFPQHTLSIKRLLHALQLIVLKHQSVHTSLVFDTEKNQVIQRIVDLKINHRQMLSVMKSIYETEEQLTEIMHEEKRNPQLFDLVRGLVFRCHILYYKQVSSNHLLCDKDVLIFNFHHALFDFPSMNTFLHDLNQAYITGQLLYDDNTNLRYLDYAVIEQQMSMTGANMFWLDALHDCKLDQPLSLPFDRYRLANEHRTGRGTTISFDFGQHLSHDFLIHASSNNISLEQLALATYYVFLFKLTNGQTDLCVAMNINNNRYRDELKSIIGLFENVIPLRCQLDPHWSFHQLLEHVQKITTNSMKYSYFPLQRILNQHPHISKHAFLDTSLGFISYKSNNDSNAMMIGDSHLVQASTSLNINEDETSSVSDFSLSLYHDSNMNQLSCTINASSNLFNRQTVEKISQRFHFILHELSASIVDNQINKQIYELSLTLLNEQYLMQSLNNTQVSFSSFPLTCIHHEFVYQVMKHPQKLAVELDEQSLTYCELLYYVQVLSLTLLNEHHVVPGEIVCQCVERSLSMVIGIMGIEMAGSVYCPLSPRDPSHRLYALTQQTQSRLVLGHWLTKMKFNSDSLTIDIQSILISDDLMMDVDVNRLSSITVKPSDTAYIIFTSGSTGIPKAVQIRHKNFIEFMHSLIYGHVVNGKDTILQIARCSYDAHVQDIMGTFVIGSSLIMLHPGGIMDFDCLANVFKEKNISCITTVPTIIQNFFTYLQQQNHRTVTQYLRSICSAGEPCSLKLINLISNTITHTFRLWNIYGPAETTIACTFYLLDNTMKTKSFPIGRPLSNYQNVTLDQFSQSVFTDQEGEFFVGGVGVFAGYLERDDLTAKALLEIDGQLFYRTGDLVTMNNNGLLHYQGRKDHQIKLHGQRIELGEIERCLLSVTSISACVVMKWNDDYLVAYVQSFYTNEEELRQHCQSHLPPHMIPSIFIILDKLPLNPNGKIDRKLLPPPSLSSTHLTNHEEILLPMNETEIIMHHIWCDLLKQNQISTDTNIFTIGGHSLVIMQLFHRYKIEFHLETNTLSISNLFQHPTIIHHAQLIQQSINTIHTLNNSPWSSLYLIQARASFAQERIYLDEQIRFSSNKTTMNNMYVIPLLYRISSMKDGVSITRLHHAFQSVITKHNILRTALYIDDTNGNIIQHCLDKNMILDDHMKSYGLTII